MNSAQANKMMIVVIAIMMVVIIMSVTAAATTATTAFGQQQLPLSRAAVATPPTDTELVDSEKVIIEQIRNILSSSRLEDYRLYENGTAEYTIRQTTALGAPVNNTITVITEHRYTPANGYIFDHTTGDITTPQGKKLVISIFD
jgi:hypothetical protein